MGLFDRFTSSPRRLRPVGQTLEHGRSAARPVRRQWLVKGGLFASLVLLTLVAFPRGVTFQYVTRVGEVWRQETLRAPFDFAIYKDEEALAAERDRVRTETPPFFQIVPDVAGRIAADRDTVAQQVDRVLDAYVAFRLHRLAGEPAEAVEDSLRYLNLRRASRLKLSPSQWELLVADRVQRTPPLHSGEAPTAPPLEDRLLEEAWQLSAQLVAQGVLDIPRDSIATNQIVVRDEREHTERRRDKNGLFGLNEVYDYVQRAYFEERYASQEELAGLGAAFFRAIFQPSLQYMRAETLGELDRRERRISPTAGVVRQGEVIVREGQVIDESIRRKLISLERVQNERSGPTLLWKQLLGQFLLIASTYLIFFLYLYLLRRSIFEANGQILLICILFMMIVGLFALAIRLPVPAMYAVPVAITSVLITVIFDSRVGIYATLTLALLAGNMLGFDFKFGFATVFAGTLGVFSVRDIKNRGQFFLSAGLVFVGYLVVFAATWLLYPTQEALFLADVLQVAINSFLLLLAYPLLWVFERTFDMTTDLTLLELSDTNRPLLKELSLRAPGTFNHSLQVANLAEAAADAIGANALLTRVGALYHDVGKMLKPEYFVENQRPGQNPHDQLKPRMSALIIASHVKDGLEMARQYNLPQRVLDFIPMHHGTTRIEYFYRRAQEQHQPEEPPILESEFRYPGPRPLSKETAILMLSDSVEAASRSLAEPTHKRLEALISMIFKTRIEDGQLDEADLTFKDLNRIKETFLAILLGIYHVRVKYPGQEGGTPEGEAPPEPPPIPPQPLQDVREEGLVGTLEQNVPLPDQKNQGEAAQEASKPRNGTAQAPSAADEADRAG